MRTDRLCLAVAVVAVVLGSIVRLETVGKEKRQVTLDALSLGCDTLMDLARYEALKMKVKSRPVIDTSIGVPSVASRGGLLTNRVMLMRSRFHTSEPLVFKGLSRLGIETVKSTSLAVNTLPVRSSRYLMLPSSILIGAIETPST